MTIIYVTFLFILHNYSFYVNKIPACMLYRRFDEVNLKNADIRPHTHISANINIYIIYIE